jgi:hypothetical protein
MVFKENIAISTLNCSMYAVLDHARFSDEKYRYTMNSWLAVYLSNFYLFTTVYVICLLVIKKFMVNVCNCVKIGIWNKPSKRVFSCKYLGKTECGGPWGYKYTRLANKQLMKIVKDRIEYLPTVELSVCEKGIYILQRNKAPKPTGKNSSHRYCSGLMPISRISYGVQDCKYPNVFSFIVVREQNSQKQFECYAFVSTPQNAKCLTSLLSSSFEKNDKILQERNGLLVTQKNIISNTYEQFPIEG